LKMKKVPSSSSMFFHLSLLITHTSSLH